MSDMPQEEIEIYIWGNPLSELNCERKCSAETIEKFDVAWEVSKALGGDIGRVGILKNLRNKFVLCLVQILQQEFFGYKFIDGTVSPNGFTSGKKYEPFIIYKSEWIVEKYDKNVPLIHYAIDFDQHDYYGLYYGIRKYGNKLSHAILQELSKKLNGFGFKESASWISWKNFEIPYGPMWQKEFYVNLLKKGAKELAEEKYSSELLAFKKDTEGLIDAIVRQLY
jgi:hypothetical protein